MDDRYVCSVFERECCLNRASECEMECMATQEEIPRYVFRFTWPDGSYTFEDASSFSGFVDLLDLFSVRQMFTLRALLDKKKCGPPGILRLYSKQSAFASALDLNGLSSKIVVDNEQVIVNFLRSRVGKIVIEPNCYFSKSGLGIPRPPQSLSSDLKFVLPTRRSLAPEQRDSAQSLIRILHAMPTSQELRSGIHFSDKVMLDFDTWAMCRSKKASTLWEPKGGFINFSRGCGRKRTIAAVFDAVCSGAMDAGTLKENRESDVQRISAPKLAVVICSSQRFNRWAQEIGNAILIQTAKDFDQLTYAAVERGVPLIMTVDALDFCEPEAQNACADLNNTRRCCDTLCKSLEYERCVRLHSNFSTRMPQSKVPLKFLKPRCVVVDDVDAESCQRVYNQAAALRADWTWIMIGYEGPSPSHLKPSLIEDAEHVLNLPDSFRINDASDQFQPDAWRMISEQNSGLLVRLRIPNTLLRKVTLIPLAAGPSDEERAFFTNFWKIRQSNTPMPVSSTNSSAALLGAPLNDIDSCCMHLALNRLRPMNLFEAMHSCEVHFKNIKGTLAQRIAATCSALKSTLAEPNFIKQTLADTKRSDCLICYSEPANIFSLCGHGLCLGCAEMARKNESKVGSIACPCCRSLLSPYDWLHIDFDKPSSTALPTTTKMKGIQSLLDSILAKRRPKKRALGSNGSIKPRVWIFAPSSAFDSLSLLLKEYGVYTFRETPDAEKSVGLASFDNIDSFNIEDASEDIIFACPAPTASDYYKIVRKCANRRSPLQLHVLFSRGIESIDEAMSLHSIENKI